METTERFPPLAEVKLFTFAPMSDDEPIIELQTQVAHLQRHVEEQDAEMYKLSMRLDRLMKKLAEQETQIKALSERSGGGDMPANEKPPHY